jgi:hypothetical protein
MKNQRPAIVGSFKKYIYPENFAHQLKTTLYVEVFFEKF